MTGAPSGGDGGAERRRLQREAVLEARRRSEVSPAAADEVLRDVEARALRYR